MLKLVNMRRCPMSDNFSVTYLHTFAHTFTLHYDCEILLGLPMHVYHLQSLKYILMLCISQENCI